MPVRKITDATVEPLTLSLARAQVRADEDNLTEDDRLTDLITVVRQAAEGSLQRTLIETEFEATFCAFASALCLERSPLIAVTSVKYLDEAGDLQTLDPSVYTVDAYATPPLVRLAYGQAWPTVQPGMPDAVRVRFTAGYGVDAASVPAPVKQWMLLHLSHYWQHRSAVVDGTRLEALPYADGLLDPYRVIRL